MKRRIAVITAAAAVVVAGVSTAVAVTVVDEDGSSWGHHDEVTSSRWSDRAGTPPLDGRAHGAGRYMGPGPMLHATTGSEYDYLAEMVAHHQEAVDSASQLERSQRPAMRAFGRSIITTQSAQIEQMKHWLADWYPDESGRVAYRPMMRDLTDLRGDRLDRAFLQDMVGHHMRAVMMSQRLLMRGAAEHMPVETLAASIRDDQRAEIARMQRWLRDWFDQGGHYGHMLDD